ncbi:biotin-dependent carboxyltransferase family protein [Paenibacillus barcinonensis]|nr:biotin-dependent carboxyltransferase family protein [Paenibacillus barcinonensis]QKS60255.1 biotin-dependent carboxyltransferase family protein [Paenibacillus barcinonensis]
MGFEVIRPGLLTLVQDEGRIGYRRYGVPVGGIMDTFAGRAANMLVGNTRHEAVLEITMSGPELHMLKDQLISICGADLSVTVDRQPVPMWRPVLLRAGSVLKFGASRHGLRAYLALAGGIDVPQVMGSRSTDLKTVLGGFHGRALRTSDVLATGDITGEVQQWIYHMTMQLGADQCMAAPSWLLSERERPDYYGQPVIRVMHGQDSSCFRSESLEQFYTRPYVVSSQSDRMGYRMQGPLLELEQPMSRLSEAVTYGTVQVPPDGQPIILMADHQTIGGYPVIAQAAFVDLPILAQLRPGAQISFVQITNEEARCLYVQRQQKFQLLDKLIRSKMAEGQGR